MAGEPWQYRRFIWYTLIVVGLFGLPLLAGGIFGGVAASRIGMPIVDDDDCPAPNCTGINGELVCGVGTSGVSVCTACPAGTYADVCGMEECVPCSEECATCSGTTGECTTCVGDGFVSDGEGGCVDCCAPAAMQMTWNMDCNFVPQCVHDPVTGHIMCSDGESVAAVFTYSPGPSMDCAARFSDSVIFYDGGEVSCQFTLSSTGCNQLTLSGVTPS